MLSAVPATLTSPSHSPVHMRPASNQLDIGSRWIPALDMAPCGFCIGCKVKSFCVLGAPTVHTPPPEEPSIGTDRCEEHHIVESTFEEEVDGASSIDSDVCKGRHLESPVQEARSDALFTSDEIEKTRKRKFIFRQEVGGDSETHSVVVTQRVDVVDPSGSGDDQCISLSIKKRPLISKKNPTKYQQALRETLRALRGVQTTARTTNEIEMCQHQPRRSTAQPSLDTFSGSPSAAEVDVRGKHQTLASTVNDGRATRVHSPRLCELDDDANDCSYESDMIRASDCNDVSEQVDDSTSEHSDSVHSLMATDTKNRQHVKAKLSEQVDSDSVYEPGQNDSTNETSSDVTNEYDDSLDSLEATHAKDRQHAIAKKSKLRSQVHSDSETHVDSESEYELGQNDSPSQTSSDESLAFETQRTPVGPARLLHFPSRPLNSDSEYEQGHNDSTSETSSDATYEYDDYMHSLVATKKKNRQHAIARKAKLRTQVDSDSETPVDSESEYEPGQYDSVSEISSDNSLVLETEFTPVEPARLLHFPSRPINSDSEYDPELDDDTTTDESDCSLQSAFHIPQAVKHNERPPTQARATASNPQGDVTPQLPRPALPAGRPPVCDSDITSAGLPVTARRDDNHGRDVTALLSNQSYVDPSVAQRGERQERNDNLHAVTPDKPTKTKTPPPYLFII